MVERGPTHDNNFEAPETGEGQPYIAPVEQPSHESVTESSVVAESAPTQQASTLQETYDLGAIANGTEQPAIVDLQKIMGDHFDQTNNDEQYPDAA